MTDPLAALAAHHALTTRLTAALSRSGLGIPSALILAALADGPLPVRRLAHPATGIVASPTSLYALERLGYVARIPGADRSGAAWAITDAGRAALADAEVRVAAVLGE